MRRPRVRFTVRTLLIGIAVVAANCWAYRYFDWTSLGIGAMPLTNVRAGWDHPVRGELAPLVSNGRAANSRTSLPGVAYFSLHFLLLGGVASHFMPGVLHNYDWTFDAVAEYAATRLTPVFGEPSETVPWIIVECSILGFFISGPPLLLAWIGNMLAMRCRHAAAASVPGNVVPGLARVRERGPGDLYHAAAVRGLAGRRRRISRHRQGFGKTHRRSFPWYDRSVFPR